MQKCPEMPVEVESFLEDNEKTEDKHSRAANPYDYKNKNEFMVKSGKNVNGEKNFIVKYKENSYEISDFLKHHPGGRQALKAYKGLALDIALTDVQHSQAAFHLFKEFALDNARTHDDLEVRRKKKKFC